MNNLSQLADYTAHDSLRIQSLFLEGISQRANILHIRFVKGLKEAI
jgi:hypothetical protein